MANAKRYDVLLDGNCIYCGPIRSAQLVYDSLYLALKLCEILNKHKLILAFSSSSFDL